MLRQLFPLLYAASFALGHSAFAAEDRAKVEAKVDATAGALSGLEFKVVPTQGLHINLEGPWKLELTNTTGLETAKTVFTRADLNESLTGFLVKASAKGATKGNVDFALTAFVCTDDKTQCYREVHKGQLPWQANAK